MTKSTMTLSRQQLYDEIWQMSVAGVARKYNLNYAKLIAKCREANIPFPPSGYWTRKNMGKDVSGEAVALPPSDNENVELLLAGVKSEKKKKVISDAEELHSDMEEGLKKAASSMEEKGKETRNEDQAVSVKETVEKSGADDTVLPFLDSVEKKRVLQAASELRIRDKKRLHEQLIKYRKSMTEWKQKEVQNQRGYQRRNRPDDEPAFFNEISPESQQRAFLILDALFCAVEELGGKVNADLSMRVMADTVRIRIAEG